MNFLIYEGTKWVDTGIVCPRCNHKILRETHKINNEPTEHFCCERLGCTWPDYYNNQQDLIKIDRKRINN